MTGLWIDFYKPVFSVILFLSKIERRKSNMTNMLAEIFIEYGKSSNMFIITIAMIFFIIGLIFGVAAIVLTVLNKFNWIDFYFYCISLLSLIGFLVVFLVGIIRVGNDVSRNIETAIRKEYADVNFLQTGITGQFISNGNTYEYEVKDKKINIYQIGRAHV